ncbi:MAG TPA: hypothetical protein VFC21_02730, partial [Bryobacteraceae bacterium]|nr:hypothetical protein [Bryobacteraceae bacterium]
SAIAPGFQGYITASCNFNNAAGYDFLAAGLGAPGGNLDTVNPETVTLPRSTLAQPLLFYGLSNQNGQDTGIAISNTTTDGFGSTSARGTCALTFFGNGAPASPFTTPNIPSGTVYATTVSSLAPGFQGYATASCTFPLARGYSYLFNGASEDGDSLPVELLSTPRSSSFSTVLLFPQVADWNGDATSISISNTSSDPFGTTPSSGACTISYFGNRSDGSAVPSPQASGSIGSGGMLTFTIGGGNAAQGIAGVPGFRGYIMANCAFSQGRGVAALSGDPRGATVSETITSAPTGLYLNVDGISYLTPQTLSWVTGSSHNVTAASPQSLSGTAFTFSSWSDNGTASHAIVAGAADATVTATYTAAPPSITAIRNAGDASAPPLAPGSLAVIFGSALANFTAVANSNPFPTTLAGATVTVNGVAAPIGFTSTSQVNFQIPYSTPLGNVSIVVTTNGLSSAPFTLAIAPTAPGIISPAILNQNSTQNSSSNPATAGTTVSVFFTGIGAVSPAVATGFQAPSSPLSTPVASSGVTINGAAVTVPFIGLVPAGQVGFAQANVTIPTNLATGTYALVLTVGGVSTGTALYVTAAPTAITSIVNGGDSSAPPLAPGSLATLFGTILANSTASTSGTPFPTTLGAVSVSINGFAAHLSFVSPGQVNLQIPYEVAPGNATVVLNNNGTISNSFSFSVAAAAPAIYPPGILNSDGSFNSSSNPTLAGKTAMVYLTGIGAVSPSVADGAAASSSPLSTPVAVTGITINGSAATVLFLGLAPGFVGIAQANVTVPSSLANGSYPLVVTVGGKSSGTATLYVGVPPVTISSPANLGTFETGTIQQPLFASGGLGSYAWTVTSGSLPPGLALRSDVPSFFSNASAGLIGVATTPGTYNFTVSVTSGSLSASRSLTMKVVSPNFQDVNLPDGFVGAAYSYAFTALGNAAAPTFTIPSTAGDGLTLTTGGVLSGAPTAAGSFSLPVTLTDGTNTILRSLNFNVYTVNLTTPAQLPNGNQGATYSTTLSASGGSGGYSYSIVSGFLPQGLGLTGNTISGNIGNSANPGNNYFQVKVTDSSGANSYTKSMAIDVIGVAAPLTRIVAGSFDDPIVGDTYLTSFGICCGGAASYTWTATGLPAGLGIRSGANASSYLAPGYAEIWGVPQQSGTFNAQLTVTDAIGGVATLALPIHVSTLDHNPSIPNGTINTPSAFSHRVLGGTPPYNAVLGAGSAPLPVGLTLGGGQQGCVAFPGG